MSAAAITVAALLVASPSITDADRIAANGGFLLGNSLRCGIDDNRVTHAGQLIRTWGIEIQHDHIRRGCRQGSHDATGLALSHNFDGRLIKNRAQPKPGDRPKSSHHNPWHMLPPTTRH